MKWAALLKGVNVGGNRKLPMAELRSFLLGAGQKDVATLLASGNAVFTSGEKNAAKLEARLAREAKAELGLDTEWLLRDHAELAAIVSANPFPDAARAHPQHLLVVFHREPFDGALIGKVGALYAGKERLEAVGRELFIDYPEDIGHSKLGPAILKAKFPKVATARNWNTVTKLAALTA